MTAEREQDHERERRHRRCTDVLLGTAVGDALGLPAEGLSAARIQRRWGRLDRYRLCGRTGFVSDDTEQSALVAQALARFPGDPDRCARAFRRSLVGWFWRLPFGVGLSTARACLRATIGRQSGVRSAGNGAAMRAAIVGAFFADDAAARRRFGTAIARVTHTDERAVQGALFVAEVVAVGAAAARTCVDEPVLAAALAKAYALAERGAEVTEAARELGTSGYVVHTVPFALFCHLRCGADAVVAAIAAGGDTDSIGAIVGAFRGPVDATFVDALHDGPFGPSHLRSLARALADGTPPPRWSWPGAMLRNLALLPVVLAHGLVRLLPTFGARGVS